MDEVFHVASIPPPRYPTPSRTTKAGGMHPTGMLSFENISTHTRCTILSVYQKGQDSIQPFHAVQLW